MTRTSHSHVVTLASRAALVGAAVVAGCSGAEPAGGSGGGPSAGSSAPAATGPTFHKDVEPILQRSCMECHSAGNIAPFSLTSYASVKSVAGLMVDTIKAGTMPPFAVRNTDECTTKQGWKGDIRLSDAEIATLDAWNKAGAPEGDPKDAPAPFVPKSRDLPSTNLDVAPKQPYVAAGDKDKFRCFVMDPGLTEDVYLNGLQVVPGNAKVVHHTLVFVDPGRKTEALADASGGFDCPATGLGMNLGVEPGSLLSAWAPGADPMDLPANVGQRIPKGSLLMMQIHYHPGGATADPDSTHLQLRTSKEKPAYGYAYRLIGNFTTPVNQYGFGLLPGPDDKDGPEFRIPADAKAHVETEQFTIPTPDSPLGSVFGIPAGARVYGDFLHMHYLGFDQKVTVTRASAPAGAAEECLAHAPTWDFSWQRSYVYDAPLDALPPLEPGDVLKIRCTYDNSKDNPYVVRELEESHMTSTVDVTLGEGNTFDEMCVTGFSLVYPMP